MCVMRCIFRIGQRHSIKLSLQNIYCKIILRKQPKNTRLKLHNEIMLETK